MADSRDDPSDTPTSLQVPARKGPGGGPAVLPDRYEPIDTLGRGGMGEVLAVRDSVLGREVAVKRMLENAPSGEDRARFLREARIQSALDHPAIPPVHELAYDADGRPYMVMKRLVGTTLSEVFAKLREQDAGAMAAFPRQRLLRAFVDVCLALELAHTRGVVHRDLKPSNIMLGEFGEVFVLDWGVAKVRGDADSDLRSSSSDHSEDATQVGVVIGTPGFMSPEQRAGRELDGRSDVFALGCLLYEILTGVRVAIDEPLPVRVEDTGAGDVPPELAALVRAATEPTPDARPTARGLGEALQRFLDGDRDIALRQKLAEQYLARATEASARGDDAGLAEALGFAGRALALDPQHAGAAALLGRLMVEPPRTTPPELAAEVEAVSYSAAKRLALQGIIGYAAYALFIPLMLFIGVDWRHIAAFIGTLVILAVTAWRGATAKTNPYRYAIAILGNVALLMIIGRMTTPFLVAPGLAAATAMLFNSTPLFRRVAYSRLVAVALLSSILVPWALELAGVWQQTLFVTETAIVLDVGVHLTPFSVHLGLLMYATGLIAAATVITRNLGRGDDEAQHQIRLYAWKLRQLLRPAA
ncbi:MAG: serine/threonine-protein kinase [Kofleriaceae bacterium]